MPGNTELIIIGFFIQFTTMAFGRFAFTLIYPDMMTHLGFTHMAMSILGTGIVVGYLINSLVSGWLSDHIGAYRSLCISILFTSLSLFILGYAQRFPVLLGASFVLGASAAGGYIPLIHILNRESGRGSVFGLVIGGVGAGILVIGYFIPLLRQSVQGYRLCWYALSAINGIVLAVSLILFRKMLRTEEYRPHPMKKGGGLFSLLMKERRLPSVLITYFLVGFSYIIYVTFFGAYAVDELGFSVQSTGRMWSFFGINMIYSGIVWGFLSDRYGKIRMGAICLFFLFLSILLIIPTKLEVFFYISTFLFGFSFMGVLSIIISVISDLVPKQSMSVVFGFATLLHGGAQALSTPLAGYLKDISGTFRVPLLVSCAIAALSIVTFILPGVVIIHFDSGRVK